MGKRTGRPRGRPKTRDTVDSSIRIDREAAFALELLSNHYDGRTKIRIMESAIKQLADGELRYGARGEIKWGELWDPVDAVRKLRLLMVEGYKTSAAEVVAKKFVRSHAWLFFNDTGFMSPRYATAEFLWPKIPEYVAAWREAGEADISGIVAKEMRAAGIPVPKRHE